jgi:hypothetical protein
MKNYTEKLRSHPKLLFYILLCVWSGIFLITWIYRTDAPQVRYAHCAFAAAIACSPAIWIVALIAKWKDMIIVYVCFATWCLISILHSYWIYAAFRGTTELFLSVALNDFTTYLIYSSLITLALIFASFLSKDRASKDT